MIVTAKYLTLPEAMEHIIISSLQTKRGHVNSCEDGRCEAVVNQMAGQEGISSRTKQFQHDSM